MLQGSLESINEMLSSGTVRMLMMVRTSWMAVIVAGMALGAGAGCRVESHEERVKGEVAQMASVRVAFTEGFDQDTVVIRVEGKQVQQHGPISTRQDVAPALAWSVDIPIDREAITLEITVPTKGAAGSIRVNVRESPQVNVSLSGKTVVLKGSKLVPSIG